MILEKSNQVDALQQTPALRFKHVSKVFGGATALKDVAFEALPGEVHCLAGENGCGKSTLIKIITGVYTPEPGVEMEYFGQRVSSITPTSARAFGIAIIWQDLALFQEMTVAENIAFESLLGNRPRLINYASMRVVASEVLSRLGVELDLDAALKTLAIAQRQIVAICRALVSNARLIFMDEPTASLTQMETDHLLKVVRKLSDSGVAIVFVSHRLAEVLQISSRVTVLRDGNLVGVYATQDMTQAQLTELMTGKTFAKVVTAKDCSVAKPILEVNELSRTGEFTDISFSIREGEIVGLTGLIGSGRTELGTTLFGMCRPESGSILLQGQEVSFNSNREAIAAGVAYVSEDRLTLGLVQEQSIADNLVLPVLQRLSNNIGLISSSKKSNLVNYWIDKLLIKIGRPQDAIAKLSGGNQQRIVLAKWLATEPKFLLLDSPTVGVDVGARAGIFEIIRTLADEGLAVLLISDELPELYFNTDRVLHMAAGRIIGDYDPRRMALNELEAAVYA